MCISNLKVFFITVLLLTIAQAAVFGDEIQLYNGDRISGTVDRLEKDVLTFKTDYAGTLSVKWSEIQSLRTDASVRIQLKDESYFTADIAPIPDTPGRVLVLEGDTQRELKSTDFLAINPEKPLSGFVYSGRVSVGITLSDGNTQKKAIATDGQVVARAPVDRWTFDWSVDQEKTEGEKSSDYFSGHVKYDYFMSEKWYALANVAAERDEIKDLSMRADIGVGTGYQFVETKTNKLSAEVGISQVTQDFIEAISPNYMAERWAVNANFAIFDTGFELFHQHDGFVSNEDFERIFIRSLSGLRMPAYKQFNTTFQIKWDWENMPPPGMHNSDVDYMFTLGIKF